MSHDTGRRTPAISGRRKCPETGHAECRQDCHGASRKVIDGLRTRPNSSVTPAGRCWTRPCAAQFPRSVAAAADASGDCCAGIGRPVASSHCASVASSCSAHAPISNCSATRARPASPISAHRSRPAASEVDRLRRGRRRARGEEQPARAVLHQLWDPHDARCDHRHAHRHRLHEHDRDAFPEAGQAECVGAQRSDRGCRPGRSGPGSAPGPRSRGARPASRSASISDPSPITVRLTR